MRSPRVNEREGFENHPLTLQGGGQSRQNHADRNTI